MIIMKFGGSSLASAHRIRQIISLVRHERQRHPIIVVSALGTTTNQLIAAADLALAGRVSIAEIAERHGSIITELNLEQQIIEPLLCDLATLLHGVSLVGELTKKTLDHIMSFGERMSARIVAMSLTGEGIPAVALNSYDIGLITDSNFGSASPLQGVESAIAAELRKYPVTPVITGFLGADENRHITTLGRNGSDFSASLIGRAVSATEIQIWTDVCGVMTCDPTLDPKAQSLPFLSYDEASELAYFGAKVLHPSTLIPVRDDEIPLHVLNTLKPDDRGTLITAEGERTARVAKSVVYKEDVCLITVSSSRLLSAVSLLSRALEVFGRAGVGVQMATTSEASVSLITDRYYGEEKIAKTLLELSPLGQASIEPHKTIICVVGEELRGNAHSLKEIFGILAERGVKARMVSQSASEINVAFLIDNQELESVVQALHTLLF